MASWLRIRSRPVLRHHLAVLLVVLAAPRLLVPLEREAELASPPPRARAWPSGTTSLPMPSPAMTAMRWLLPFYSPRKSPVPRIRSSGTSSGDVVARTAARGRGHHRPRAAMRRARRSTLHDAMRAPQREQRRAHPAPGLDVGAIVLQVDGGGRAVVLAARVHRARREAALVFRPRLGRERRQPRRALPHLRSAGSTPASGPIMRSGANAGWIRKNQCQ